MEYSPPPLFKQGPSALARLFTFVGLALVLLMTDARFQTLEVVREVIGTGLYPLQRAALVPRDLIVGGADLFVTIHSLRSENQALRDKNLQLSVHASQAAQLLAENEHLRRLLQLQQHSTIQTTPTEIQYDTRDPFTQKVIIAGGSRQDVQAGAPVVNENGVIGQVTRVFPLQSEVTLLTDKDQAVPVQVVRTGIRSIIYGTPKGDVLDLRFVPTSADVKTGDELVTSGLDGIYPPGLPVAKVIQVDRQTDTTFARVVCEPLAPVRGARQLLVLRYDARTPPRPTDTDTGAASTGAAKAAGKAKTRKDAKAAAGNSTAKPAATPARAAPATVTGARQ
ncbi:rod shape-determining protein MreC [Mycetohabitans sp. B46]|uniref:rod shape-determining protein MreC n=1 Tax=Mycetohabitans sp. B46 TaxID=2772536 RepID=UPI00307F001B